MERWFKTCYGVLLIIVLLFLNGCSESEITQPVTQTIYLEGKVFDSPGYEEIYKSGSAVKDAIVDIYFINSDGSEQLLSEGSVETGSDGKFHIEADLSLNQEYLIIAKKNNNIWKAIIKAAPQNEITVFVQPINIESTVEAEIYLLSKKKGYQVNYYDVSLLIDIDVAGFIIDNPESEDELAETISNAVVSRNNAFLNPFFGGNIEGISLINREADVLQAKFARDLHFAKSTNTVKAIVSNYNESFLDAFSASGFSKENIIRLLEIYYRILLKKGISAKGLELNLIKSGAYFKAKVANNSNISDFQRLNSGGVVKSIKEAGDELYGKIRSADNYEKIRLSFYNYNQKLLKSLVKAAGINEDLKDSIEVRINTSLLRLYSDFNVAADPEQVTQAFINYYSGVSSEIKNLLKSNYKEQSEILAEMMIILYIDF